MRMVNMLKLILGVHMRNGVNLLHHYRLPMLKFDFNFISNSFQISVMYSFQTRNNKV